MTSSFIFRWDGWRRFGRDMLVVQTGFLLFGISINLMVRADLGASSWVALEKSLTRYVPISLGQATILVAFLITLVDLILRQPLGWGTLANMLSIGLWTDAVAAWIPPIPHQLGAQLLVMVLATAIMGFGTGLYVGANVGAGPRDSLMLAIARVGRVSVRLARTLIEVVVVVGAWLLGGPVGLGTLIFALLIGPAVQISFRLLKVRPLTPEVALAVADEP